MSRALGAENYPFVVVSHPISSTTKNELNIQASNSLEEGIKFLLKSERITKKQYMQDKEMIHSSKDTTPAALIL